MKHKKLDIENWSRKDHFHFFRKFEEPFFGVCVDVDISKLYLKSKQEKESLYLSYMHRCLIACNEVDNFKYRIEGDKIIEYSEVGASAVVLREDKSFGFSYIPFQSDFKSFKVIAEEEIKRVKSRPGLEIDVAPSNIIQLSALPWFKFTSMSHARSFSYRGSNPMISFGKVTNEQKKIKMPVSIHVHHGLMDGWHVSQFLDIFQKELNN